MASPGMNAEAAFELAKEQFAEWGVDVEQALRRLSSIAISLHCWQGDDVGGFEAQSGPAGPHDQHRLDPDRREQLGSGRDPDGRRLRHQRHRHRPAGLARAQLHRRLGSLDHGPLPGHAVARHILQGNRFLAVCYPPCP